MGAAFAKLELSFYVSTDNSILSEHDGASNNHPMSSVSTPHTVDGEWSPWDERTACTKACGGGMKQRFRLCQRQRFGGERFPGDDYQIKKCQKRPCTGKWFLVQYTGSGQRLTSSDMY